jgi:uncharacterized protein
MASYDPSHDFLHVNRVRKTALSLARRVLEEQLGVGLNIFIVEVAALFHDLFECAQNLRFDHLMRDTDSF